MSLVNPFTLVISPRFAPEAWEVSDSCFPFAAWIAGISAFSSYSHAKIDICRFLRLPEVSLTEVALLTQMFSRLLTGVANSICSPGTCWRGREKKQNKTREKLSQKQVTCAHIFWWEFVLPWRQLLQIAPLHLPQATETRHFCSIWLKRFS